jgi:DnaK suppressor protein
MFVSLPQLPELAVSSGGAVRADEKEVHGRAAGANQGINRGHDGASHHTKGRIAGFCRAAAGAADARRREVKAQPKVVAKTKKPAAKAVAKARSAKPAAKAAKPAAKAPTKKAAVKPAAKTVAKTSKPAAKAAKPAGKPTAKTAVKAAPAKAAKTAAKPAKPVTGKALGAAAKAVVAAAKKIPARTPPAPLKGADARAAPSNAAPTRAATQPPSPPARAPASTGRGASAAAAALANAAPDGAKATYIPMANQSVVTPPPVVAVKKDPKLANNWKTKTAEELSDAEVLAMPDTEYMNDKQMAFFRLKLLQLKTEILNSAGETTEHLREDTVIVPDPADRATIEEEHALELRTRDRERKLLKKIEQSIGRIDAGDYGYCDETGEPIGVGRLLARPTATLSLEAQQRRELKQKMFGD